MAGDDKILGTAIVKMKIFDAEKLMRVYVVKKETFRQDVLFGLDTIFKFKLEQDFHGNTSVARENTIMNRDKNSRKSVSASMYNVENRRKQSRESVSAPAYNAVVWCENRREEEGASAENREIESAVRMEGKRKTRGEDEAEEEEILVNWNEAIPVEEFEIKIDHLDDKKR